MEHLDGFLKQQKSTSLNDEMLGKMQEAVVSILSPICKDKKEKSALEKNAAKLVRQCAADVGKKMSWSQAWERFKDRVSDIVGSLIHSDNLIKKIIAQHPKLKQTLESNLKNTDAKTIIPKAKPRDSISR